MVYMIVFSSGSSPDSVYRKSDSWKKRGKYMQLFVQAQDLTLYYSWQILYQKGGVPMHKAVCHMANESKLFI